MSIPAGTALLMYQTSTLAEKPGHDMQHIHLQLFFFLSMNTVDYLMHCVIIISNILN